MKAATNTGTSTSECPTQNVSMQSLVRYDKSRHIYVCLTCKREHTFREVMRRHIQCHTGNRRPYSCEVCQRTFTRQQHLKIHSRTHSGEKPYSCVVCNRAFADSSSLRRHLRIHTGERPYACDICTKRFNESTSLTIHKRTHTKDQPFPDRSTEQLIDSSSSDVRMNASAEVLSSSDNVSNNTEQFTDPNIWDVRTNADTNEQSFTNEKNTVSSSEQFTNLGGGFDTLVQESLSTSASNVSRSANNLPQITDVRNIIGYDADTRQYYCTVCSKRYHRLEEMKRHIRCHTGERPFTCDLCQRTFAHRHQLKNHKQTHFGEKLYPCFICEKTFSCSNALKKHIQVHMCVERRNAGKFSSVCANWNFTL